MTYKKFLQYEVAGKYLIPDDDKLIISFYQDNYFVLTLKGLSCFNRLMNIESISYVVKALGSTFGEDNHSYKSWLSVLSYAKDYLYNMKH